MKRFLLGVLLACLLSIPFAAQAADQNTIVLTRESSANEQGFNIYRLIQPSTVTPCPTTATAPWGTKIATIPSGTLFYVDAPLPEGVLYCYAATAYNTAGESVLSNIAGRTVPFVTPSAPSITVGP